jgi:hypothetical protein
VVEMLLTKMPASAVKDRVRVTITCGNLLACTPLTHYEGGAGPGLASAVPSRAGDRVSVQGKKVLTSRSPRCMGGYIVPG